MKKKFCGLLAVVMMAAMLAGCGTKGTQSSDQTDASGVADGTVDDVPLSQLDLDKYVTLGDYNNLQVSLAPVSVNEEELEELILEVYTTYLTDETGKIMDRAVESGDILNIDYVGKRDGVAFANGSAEDALLTIGSGRFIAGFEDGLIGVMPGETVDLDLSFPDPYPNNPNLAGVAVVFTVTVNYIMGDMLDEVVARMEIDDVNTVEEFRQYVYDYLYEIAQEDYILDLQDEILTALVEQCEFGELPEAMLKQSRETLAANLENTAAQIGVTSDMFVSFYYNGMSVEEFTETYAPVGVKQNLALQAIANKEGLAVDDEELQSRLEEYALMGGYASVDDFVGELSREDFRNYFMSIKVINFLTEKVQAK